MATYLTKAISALRTFTMIDIAMPRHAREPSSSMNGRLAQASRFDDALLPPRAKMHATHSSSPPVMSSLSVNGQTDGPGRRQPSKSPQSRARCAESPAGGCGEQTKTIGRINCRCGFSDHVEWRSPALERPRRVRLCSLMGDLTDAAFVHCAGFTKCSLLLSARVEFDRPAG